MYVGLIEYVPTYDVLRIVRTINQGKNTTEVIQELLIADVAAGIERVDTTIEIVLSAVHIIRPQDYSDTSLVQLIQSLNDVCLLETESNNG